MIRVLSILFLVFSFSNARENPFFPVKGEKNMPYTSNADISIEPLKRATISLPTEARIIKKVTIEYKCLDGSIEKKSIELYNSVDWHLPIFISQDYAINTEDKQPQNKTKQTKFTKLLSFKYASFFASSKTLKIVTKDKIIRNFMLVEPHRIVIDFKRDANFRSYVKTDKNMIFKKIRVGNHAGYYRVVIELDGQYRFQKKKLYNGYLFTLR